MGRQQGLTLVELLVAMAVLALMAGASWLGIDAMVKVQERTAVHSQKSGTLHIGLSQLSVDLDNAVLLQGLEPVTWDGKVLRLTRRPGVNAGEGPQVVAWSVVPTPEGPYLMRWSSVSVKTRGQWMDAWNAAANWGRGGGGGSGQVSRLFPALGLNIHFWSANRWTHTQSTRKDSGQPNGLRFMISTPEGDLHKDWANPLFTPEKAA